MRTLVLGLGNPLLTDDAVGLLVARALRSRLGNRSDVEVDEGALKWPAVKAYYPEAARQT